jgi:protein involved in polysaccharide export with SLBB domain
MSIIFAAIPRRFVKSVSSRRLGLVLVVSLAFATGLWAERATAQQASMDQLKQLQQMLGNSDDQTSVSQSNQPTGDVVLQPSNNAERPLPPSRLEQIMSSRAGVRLRQFGYDQFGSGQTVTIPQTGAVQSNYVLGAGDEIVVSLRGQENNEYRTRVDRNGNVILPRLNPIAAAGRTLGDFEADVAAAVHRAFISTQVFVSVGRLRQINVTVSGEVNDPGNRILTGLSSPLDAILLSGGFKKSGSLRNVKLVRAGHQITIDLYSLLTQHGVGNMTRLADGDRIIVPPLGPTVAVTGWVRRPGIYELGAGQRAIAVQTLLALSGGTEVRGHYRLSALRIQANGSSMMAALPSENGTIRDSEILFVQQGADKIENQATLSGGTALAGVYSVGRASRLSDLFKAPGALGRSPYTLFGIIVRRDPVTQLSTLKAITPVAVLNGTEDVDLVSGDIVRNFSVNEARLLSAVAKSFEQKRLRDQENLFAPKIAQQIGTNSTNNGNSSNGNNSSNRNNDNGNSLRNSDADTGTTFGNTDTSSSDLVAAERSDIAALSDMTLGNGGVLVPAYPTPTQNDTQQASQQVVNVYPATPSGAYPDGTPVAAGKQGGGQSLQAGYPMKNGYDSADSMPDNYQRYSSLNPAPNFEDQFVGSGGVPSNREARTFGEIARQLNVDPLVLMQFIVDNEATISGAVRGPGNYIVGPSVTMRDLIAAAGGMLNDVDRTKAELISSTINATTGRGEVHHELVPIGDNQLASYIIKPHDDLRLNQVYTDLAQGSVTIQGQVRYPGDYKISGGRRLSELLLRAGGLTDYAYPYGTVLLRKSVAQTEREGFQRTARDLENVIVAGMTHAGNDKVPPETLQSLQAFVTELKTQPALGRVSVIANPAMLASDPSKDILLEPGDVIFIPQRPSSVSVLGEVLKTGSFSFRSGESVDDYIDQAGGYGPFADKSLTFIVLPDGTSRRVDKSWFNLDAEDIPPGSSIVVSRDISPFDLHQTIVDTVQILSQLAVSAASLSVISHN